MNRAVDGIERVGHRKVPDAPIVDRRVPREHRLVQRAVDRGDELGAARAADIPKEPLKHAQVGVAHGPERDALVAERDGAVDPEPCLVADQLELLDAEDLAVQHEPDGPGVAHGVVEQPQIQAVHGRVHQEVIDIRERADDADGAAGHGGRERREPGLEQADVRVERGVVETQRQLGLGSGRQGDPSGPCDRQSGRRGIDLTGHLFAAERQRAGHLSDAFVGDKEIGDAKPHVIPRDLERPASAGGEVDEPRRLQSGVRERRRALHWNPPGVCVERIGGVPPDVRGAGHGAAVHGNVDVVQPHARSIEAQRRRAAIEGFAVRHALLDRHRAEPDRGLVASAQRELARQPARDRIRVDREGMAQRVHVAPGHPEARVELLPAVAARVAEREPPVRANLRTVAPHRPAGDRHVAVLDHNPRAAVAPERVPGAHVLAVEDAFHAWAAKRAGHHSVELAASAEGHRAGLRAEVSEDAGQYLVALLPVAARDVEREARRVAPGGLPFERHVRLLRGKAAGMDLYPFRVEPVAHRGADGQVCRQQVRRKRAPLVARVIGIGRARGHQGRAHGVDAPGPAWRIDRERSISLAVAEAPERPLQDVPAGRGASEAETRELVEVRHSRDVNVGVGRVEASRRSLRGPERRDREGELRLAAIQVRPRIPDLEAMARPPERALQQRKAVLVHARDRAPEGPGQIVSALE